MKARPGWRGHAFTRGGGAMGPHGPLWGLLAHVGPTWGQTHSFLVRSTKFKRQPVGPFERCLHGAHVLIVRKCRQMGSDSFDLHSTSTTLRQIITCISMIAEERVRINTAEFINHSMRSLAFMGPVINHGLPSEARGSGPGRAMDRRPPAHRAPWAQARKPANGWSERFTFIKVSNGRTRICYAPVAVPLEITVYLPIVGGVALGTATPYAQEYKGFGVQLRKTRALKHPPFVVTRQTVS